MPASKKPEVLGRDAILAAQDLRVELVEVPEWGGSVYVRGLSGSERDKFEEESVRIEGTGRKTTARANLDNIRARLVARCLCDESGERLFSDSDVTELGRKSAAALDRCFEAAQRLSGLRAEDIEELSGN